MKTNRVFSLVIAVCAVMSVLLCNVYAADFVGSAAVSQVSKEQLTRMMDVGVSKDDISFLYQQIELYNPTETQIANYVEDLIANEVRDSSVNSEPINYPKTANGDTITPDGVIPFQDITQKWSSDFLQKSVRAVSKLSNRTNSNDQSGVYYVVNSTSGHNQLTSFATLPSLSSVNAKDRPYHMLGMSSTNGSNSMYGDIGLVYFPASGQWKGFYNVVENGNRYENYNFSFTGSSNIYFHLQMYTNKAVLIIRDAASWSEVGTVEYTFNTNCVPSNFSTTKLSKQITLAQHLSGSSLDISSGTTMSNAQFSQSWLYTTSTNHSFSSTYCSEAYRQGPTAAAYNKVNPTYTAWTTDNVTISFN